MYRIRLASGEEAVYKTVEELAQAVTSGVISPTAEVFHKAGNRWLPINTHPDYRAVVTGKRQAMQQLSAQEIHKAAGPPASGGTQSPVRAPTRKSQPAIQFEVVEPAASSPAPVIPDPPAPPVVSAPATVPLARQELDAPFPDLAPEPEIISLEPNPVAHETPAEVEFEAPLRRLQRPKRPTLSIALGVAGLVAAAGLAAILLTGPQEEQTASALPSETEGMAPAPVANPNTDTVTATPAPTAAAAPAAETPKLARPDTIPVVYPAPSKPLVPGSTKPAANPPAPPPRTVSRLGTTVNKMPSYYEAYADARAEMDEGLAYVEFRRVFAPSRFANSDSIRTARRMIAAAGNILRVYRGREVMLEQTYRPGEPDGKGSLRETFEVGEASRGLLADVDSLFAILVGQEGEVKYRDNALSFRNSRAAQAYSNTRRRILQTLSYLGDPAEAADRVTMPRLLRAFGNDRPPPAR